MVNKLLKTFSAGFDNRSVKLGYVTSAVAGLGTAGLSYAITKNLSLAPYFMLAGPAPLFICITALNYDVGRRELEKEDSI